MNSKRDLWAEYPDDGTIRRILASGRGFVIQDDLEVEYVGMPDDFGEAFAEFNRRVNEGDMSDAVVTDSQRPDDPRVAGK